MDLRTFLGPPGIGRFSTDRRSKNVGLCSFKNGKKKMSKASLIAGNALHLGKRILQLQNGKQVSQLGRIAIVTLDMV